MKADPVYCDHCGRIVILYGKTQTDYWEYTELPFSVESANAGESGIICDFCDVELWKKSGQPRPRR